MSNIQTFDDATKLAEAAAKQSVAVLKSAIKQYGSATWVLAGGSTPQVAHRVIAEKYFDAIDWSQVTVIMGDERIGPLDGPDNNWHAIDEIIGELSTVKLQPQSDKSAEVAAADYEQKLSKLPAGNNGLPRLDLVWLGVGADGHTLSLFPQHNSMLPSGGLVVAVHDSPKPPADRISLTFRALMAAENVLILATGDDKRDAIAEAINGGTSPIALAASIVTTREGNVSWLLDKSAAPTD
jgi:6-phosphogluconolactonase